ncbi:MAG: FHA domain-containing protein [Gammaproteobacteria bacterium]|nr:FHA domain-containing protein [Gammaproteobacteria bacterium]
MTSTLENTPQSSPISVQLIHIDGPYKGKIDEFNQDSISIGRDQDNDVVFPAELRSISRHHARLIRQGDQFLFLSLGKNSCLMNQTALDERTIQSGDIIWLTQNGPRISFLTRTHTPSQNKSQTSQHDKLVQHSLKAFEEKKNQKTEFTFQYDTTIKSMTKALVRLGSSADADFRIDHPCVSPIQSEIIFRSNEFYIRDISNRGTTLLNGEKIFPEALLQANDIITLGKDGIKMRFLGTGRFSELPVEEKQLDRRILNMLDEDEKEIEAIKRFLEPVPESTGIKFVKSILNKIWRQ